MPVGNVVVLHGILGAELNATNAAGASMPIGCGRCGCWRRVPHLELEPAGERK